MALLHVNTDDNTHMSNDSQFPALPTCLQDLELQSVDTVSSSRVIRLGRGVTSGHAHSVLSEVVSEIR